MFDPNKITGEKRFEIIKGLLKDRTIIRINLLGKGYEGLTMVMGVYTMENIPLILIDRPIGYSDYFQDTTGERIFLEFIGKDKIQYNFKTIIEKEGDEDIFIQFPQEINRVQRRRHFRIEPLMGTSVIFMTKDRKSQLNVINLSMGGLLVSQEAVFHNKETFYKGRYLRDILLICEDKGIQMRIKIPKSEIVRVEKNEEIEKYGYAIQFLDLNKDTIRQLHVFIYMSQRVVLRKWGSLVDN
ncbi:MAG: PilZ domain-containing protein [Deltaproteobacteria bacterium]|nr:PilZ domain-containing protein [Deltaproteobacteria bacterium]